MYTINKIKVWSSDHLFDFSIIVKVTLKDSYEADNTYLKINKHFGFLLKILLLYD